MHEQPPATASVSRLLQRIRSLSRRQVRDAAGCFWIEGIRHFVQAYDAGLDFEAMVQSRVLLKSDLADMLARRLSRLGCPRVRLSPEQFRSISTAQRASGIGAILRQRWTPLSQAQPAAGLCWIVVEEIRSPGNLGTILRTAEACGAGGVVFLGPRCDPFDPVVLRASMSGILHLPLVRATHAEFARWSGDQGVELVGLSPAADRLWTELPADAPIALVIGEERRGLSEPLQALCRHTVRLPMTGRADSLNVGVAAGVVMYELVRRKLLSPDQRVSLG
jgi:TrmH family RNA methyltransferase